VTWLFAAVTDIGSPFDPAAVFRFKIRTDIVADVAGTAQGVTDNQLPAGVLFPAFESADTEVIGIIKTAPVPCINNAVAQDLFRDGGGILAEILCDLTKGKLAVKRLFNKLPVFQGKMFMVSGYKIRHNRPPLALPGNSKEDTEKRCGYQ